jgi:hypothetical protein
MARKTIPVDRVREIANAMLADSIDDRAEGRTAIAVLLESILMETGNYHGFQNPGHPGPYDYDTDATDPRWRWIDANGVAVDDSRRRYF